MQFISDDEQQSYRAKSWLPDGLRRRRAIALSRLLEDVPHRLRRCFARLLRRRLQRGPRDLCHRLRAAVPVLLLLFTGHPVSAEEHWRSAVLAADGLKREGRFTDAERMLLAALDEVHGSADPGVAATIYNNLGGVYQDMGRCDPAARAYQRSIEMWEKAGARGEAYLLKTSNYLVGLYLECGDAGNAERQYRAMVAPRIARRPGRDRDPDVAQALADLGSIDYARHKYREGRQHYEEALAILERFSSEPTAELAILLNNLAFALARTGEPDQAVADSRRSVAVAESAADASILMRIAGLANAGDVCATARHFPEAEALLERALAMARETIGEEHPITAKVMWRYAALLKETHRKKEAAVLEARVREIRQRLTGPSQRQTVDLRELSTMK